MNRIRFVHVKRLDLTTVSDDVFDVLEVVHRTGHGMGCHRQGDCGARGRTLHHDEDPLTLIERESMGVREAGVLKGVHQVVGLARVVLDDESEVDFI